MRRPPAKASPIPAAQPIATSRGASFATSHTVDAAFDRKTMRIPISRVRRVRGAIQPDGRQRHRQNVEARRQVRHQPFARRYSPERTVRYSERMLLSRIVRIGAAAAALAVAGWLLAQSPPPSKQYVVLLKRGPKWVAGKPAAAQDLGNHGRYLQEQMTKGALQLAGPFLDDSGGLVLYNAKDEAEARAIAGHDPGVAGGILAVESVRPFYLAFDAASGKSPFNAAK